MTTSPLVRRLLHVVDAMAADLSETSLLQQLSQSTLELFGATGACWCPLRGDVLTIATEAGLPVDLVGLTFPLEGSAAGRLLAAGQRSLVDRADRFPHLNDRIYATPDDRVAVALASLGGEVTGALYVTLRPGDPFGPDELEVLELLASHAGMALHHVALYNRAERARQEQEAVIGAMADGVAVIDAAGRVTTWNRSMERMTGRPAHEVVGGPVPFPLPMPGEVLTSRPGGGRWVDVVAGIAGPHGERVVSARDVTAAKELEVAQEVFLATASHELRTPLTVLRGYGDTLLRHWEVLDEPARRELVSRMLSRTEGMADLVEQLLQASVAGLAAADQPLTPFDLAEVVAAAVRVLSGSSVRHPVQVDAPVPVPAMGRPETIAALLDQLVENAVKYSPAGGSVDITVRSEADAAVLSVSDRGRGIAEDERERVFERFYRGVGGPEGPTGAGLGLWIVRRTVEAQGGQVSAAERPGGGTVVQVRLPAGRGARTPEAPPV